MADLEFIKVRSSATDITRKKFGRLTAIGPVRRDERCKIYWLVICQCGTESVVHSDSLVRGLTKSCGCLQAEVTSAMSYKHGMGSTPEYKAWEGMKQRCENQNEPEYKNYGQRGIRVEYESFMQFFADVGNRPSPKHTIDRADNDGNYAPGNCRWATRKEQMRNYRGNINITHRGKTQCIAAWSEETGVSYTTIRDRYRKDWPLDLVFRPTVHSREIRARRLAA